ncbi:McrB family protein [Tenacibaculum finnmarkense]|uniref:AAA domain-containing protein n=1 Tax=Tenacibaculum finnmarkense genomovar finnmarkense TaxID=1458503 RepID=A0AAP1WFV1_9FLAO|nr:AAA family ATPase [Tenacibaculum finnmarkense]MBE7652486.1 AAA domain-containing protein [Tenacibaculum finnmarkense genomovar finnmarkense]MBE7694704.1 AAA domain-containing protein [Tenacibaculum finnmarkense genomovar finnmarkense]MCD8427030.1 AAA family ATPase [Tenacibaculum finnmarkense genomovar finnmarkense]MCG8731165.1 AAA domain-containing protein [Tenacibaculum finnmarkense]MCG8752874.1 AAA domain-containing protein [Tenacibaculum finnmarkense]
MKKNFIEDFEKAKNYYNKVQHKEALQEFINLAYSLCAQHKIANYRLAIKGKEIMLIIGMRAVLNFKEENETSFIGVIVNNDFIDKLPKINSDLHAFGGSDNKSLLTLNYTLFLEYKNEIIAHIQAVILEELKAIKGHSKEFWNTTSTTTSVSFKHIVNENVLLETYFNKKEIIFKEIPAVLKDKIDVLHHKKQIILQGPPGTGKTRLAKQIASEMTISENNFKVIQFHPSYTYEDFVRGISVKNNQDGNIEYKTENKVLAKIAKEALKNYTDSQKETESLSKELNLKEYFTLFVDFIEDKIEENNGFFKLTDNVGLLSSDEDAFRYKGKNDGWTKNGNRMLFKDILQAFTDENTVRQDLKKNPNLSGLAKQHASYFVRILNMFQEFFKNEKLTFENTSVEKVALKNYVLIIDEINRANLSSVLGELIYALEYRGEAVESMYDIDGNRKITLPPNLYIIGTMNTADRSVGQIDYAIRRRFAFIDVLPEILEESTLENDLKFNTDSFNEVEALFVGDNNHLSDEFKAKDVQLGHSYFIYKEANFDMNLKYEIKPILQEYVADGILKESALELIEALKSHL